METVDWHGWSSSKELFTGETIHVGPLPGRKSICLYTMDYREKGAVKMNIHAYFRSEQEAQKFLGALDRLVGTRGIKGELDKL